MPENIHYGMWLPPDFSVHGYQIDRLIFWLHVLMISLFIGWGIFFVMCLVKFRQRQGGKAEYQLIKAKASKVIEVVVAGIEALLLLALSHPLWARYKQPELHAKDALEIRVVAQQFAWNFQYPGKDNIFGQGKIELIDDSNFIGIDKDAEGAKDDVVTLGNLYLPADRPVILHIRSKDVIHSFWIPVLRIKQDTIPGMEIPIWFQAKPEGIIKDKNGKALSAEEIQQATFKATSDKTQLPGYDIACAQLCGLNHYGMKGRAYILSPEEFQKWYDAQPTVGGSAASGAAAAPAEEFTEE